MTYKNIDRYLYDHVNFELGNNNKLFEKHGYVSNMSEIAFRLAKAIADDFSEDTVFIVDKEYSDMSIFDGLHPFFNEFKAKVKLECNEYLKENNVFGLYNGNSVFKYENDKLVIRPLIEIEGRGNSKVELLKKVYRSIGHEFTHAYHDYMLFINSNGEKRLKDNGYYHKINLSSLSGNAIDKIVGEIYYYTSDIEMNAHIASVKQDLDSYEGPFNDSEQITHAIQKTDCYNNLKKCMQKLNELKQKTNIDDQQKIITVVNNLSNKNFSTFNKAIKFLTARINRYYNNFYKKSSKIASDVYLEKQLKNSNLSNDTSTNSEQE